MRKKGFTPKARVSPSNVYLRGKTDWRQKQAELFIRGEIEVPEYDYELLQNYVRKELLKDVDVLTEDLNRLVMHKASSALEETVNLLQKHKIEQEIVERYLLRAAAELLADPGSEGLLNAYIRRNIEVYGEYDVNLSRQVIQGSLAKDLENDYRDTIEFYRSVARRKFYPLLSLLDNLRDDERVNAERATELINNYLHARGLSQLGWIASISPEAIIVHTKYRTREIVIPKNFDRTVSQLRRLMVHEVEAHAARYEHGLDEKFPIVATGTVSSKKINEGLGIFLELLIDQSPVSEHPALRRALHRYAALCFALDTSEDTTSTKHIFKQLFKFMHDEEFNEKKHAGPSISKEALETYAVFDNVYRGSDFRHPKAVYMRGKNYLEGLIAVLTYLSEAELHESTFDLMFRGTIDFTSRLERSMLDL